MIDYILALTLVGNVSFDDFSEPTVEQKKEYFLKAVHESHDICDCVWVPIFNELFRFPESKWHYFWRRYQEPGYVTLNGRTIWGLPRREIKRVEKLALQYGIKL